MNWISLILAQDPAAPALPPSEISSWTQTGIYGFLTLLLGYLITKGLPQMVEDFRAETKEARSWHTTEMAEARRHYRESQESFQNALEDTVTKFATQNEKLTDKIRDSWKGHA